MKFRQKLFAAMTALLMLLSASGCETEGPAPQASDPPPPPTDYVKYTGEWQDTDEPLRVCITDRQDDFDFTEHVEETLEYLTGKDVSIEWTVIPQYAVNAEAALTQLRTEMMAGGGPDVFIVSTAPASNIYIDEEERPTVLFPMPEKMLYNGSFLPLDGLLENAQYMDADALQPTVLAAGRTEQGQLLLPVSYECSMVVFNAARLSDPDALPKNLEEMLRSEDPDVVRNMAGRSPGTFHFLPGRLADYSAEKLLFSEEEFQDWAVQWFAFEHKYLDRIQYWCDNVPQALATRTISDRDYFKDVVNGVNGDREKVIAPQWNADGGVTAIVNQFAAVNRNTKQANNAMFLLDVLFSTDVLSGNAIEGVREDGDSHYYLHRSRMSVYGIPINNAAFSREFNPEAVKLAEEISGKITAVRFHSAMDDVLYQFGYDLMDCESELDVMQAASNTYSELQMMIAE